MSVRDNYRLGKKHNYAVNRKTGQYYDEDDFDNSNSKATAMIERDKRKKQEKKEQFKQNPVKYIWDEVIVGHPGELRYEYDYNKKNSFSSRMKNGRK